MDLSYATIPVFGALRRLYRESWLAYMISNKENPKNHPIYSVDTDMGSSMLFNEVVPQKDEPKPTNDGSNGTNQQSAETTVGSEADNMPLVEELKDDYWCMSFNGAASKEGAGVGVLIKPPMGEPKLFSYKLHLNVQTTQLNMRHWS